MNDDKPYFVIRSLANPSSQRMTKEKRRLLKQRRKERGKDANLTKPDGVPEFAHLAQMAAVQDLQVVIAHVSKLFAGRFSEKQGFIDILKEFESTVSQVELGVLAHGFPNLGDNEEYEEIGLLENILSDYEYFEFSIDGPKGKLLSSLTDFWLYEIKCRVVDLIELLTVRPAYDEVTNSFSALKNIRFPK